MDHAALAEGMRSCKPALLLPYWGSWLALGSAEPIGIGCGPAVGGRACAMLEQAMAPVAGQGIS